MSLPPRLSGDKPFAALASATAIGLGIAAVELFDVELSRCEGAARTGVSGGRTKIPFVGCITAPFAEAAPEAAPELAEEAEGGLGGTAHQSSPWAVPE